MGFLISSGFPPLSSAALTLTCKLIPQLKSVPGCSLLLGSVHSFSVSSLSFSVIPSPDVLSDIHKPPRLTHSTLLPHPL